MALPYFPEPFADQLTKEEAVMVLSDVVEQLRWIIFHYKDFAKGHETRTKRDMLINLMWASTDTAERMLRHYRIDPHPAGVCKPHMPNMNPKLAWPSPASVQVILQKENR
jgi:hypothetical protein